MLTSPHQIRVRTTSLIAVLITVVALNFSASSGYTSARGSAAVDNVSGLILQQQLTPTPTPDPNAATETAIRLPATGYPPQQRYTSTVTDTATSLALVVFAGVILYLRRQRASRE